MVRKITAKSGGWRKSFKTGDQHRELERSAARALAAVPVNSMKWHDSAIRTLTNPLARRPGAVLAARVQHALLTISKLIDEQARNNPHRLVAPMDCGLTGPDLVAAYLSNTPFFDLLMTPLPFSLPDDQRFSGHWIVAPPGR